MSHNLWVLILWFVCCSCGNKKDDISISGLKSAAYRAGKKAVIRGIVSNQKLVIGDTIQLSAEVEEDLIIDTTQISLAGSSVKKSGQELTLITSGFLPGKYTATVEVMVSGENEQHTFPVEFVSEIVPVQKTYQRVAFYTHDPDAYTQGLFFHNGFIYENTGRKGQSSLRKVALKSGKVLKAVPLANQYFGEGITRWKDQIIQLTWTSNKGFVYNLESFELIKSFDFPTQGWGITTIQDRLVMSDGTERLYFLDPETLTETGRLHVYDNNGPVKRINELEYIEGLIYANIYDTDNIITIDPETGKVLALIDMTGLMNAQWGRQIDVLNGIAYDEVNKIIFVTGKLWPRLYEVKIRKKEPV